MAADLASKCQAILDKATHAENGPPGMCFGAVNREGKVLVEIGSGKRSVTVRELSKTHADRPGLERHDDPRLDLRALVDD